MKLAVSNSTLLLTENQGAATETPHVPMAMGLNSENKKQLGGGTVAIE